MTLIVCADHDTPVPRSDYLSTPVVAVAGLCGDPTKLANTGVRDTEAIILHLGEFDLGFVQGAIGDTGVDPLSVPIVALGDMPSLDQMEILAAGAAARHATFDSAHREHAKIRWPESVWRSRFFSLSAPQRVGVPWIDRSLCSAGHGCRLCVATCPASALKRSSDGIAHDIDACVACGICITTCPTAATANPTIAEDQVSAQIRAMVDTAADAIGIEFRCRDAQPQLPVDGWFPVEVPCTGMLTIGWLIAPLMLGAGAVAAQTCSESGCSIGNDDVLVPRRNAARKLLDTIGLFAGRLCDRAGDVAPTTISSDATRRLGTFRDAEVFLALADIANTADWLVSSEVASTGVVRIDVSTCTVCEQCVSVCPSDALTSERFGGIIEISFDPFPCTGCAMCVQACPVVDDDAIILDHRLDAAVLTIGRRVLVSAHVSPHDMRPDPITLSVTLDRTEPMSGSNHTGTVSLVSHR